PPPTFTLFPYTTLFRSYDSLCGHVTQITHLDNPITSDRNVIAERRPASAIDDAAIADDDVVFRRRGDAGSRQDNGGKQSRQEKRSEEHTSELQSLRHLV